MDKFARELRKSSTDAELRLWMRLKNRNLGGFKFRRQHPVPPYVVDFVCLVRGLIEELDGGQHAEQTARDAARTAALELKGFRLIRFWNDEALNQTDAVLEEILRQLSNHPDRFPLKLGEIRWVQARRFPYSVFQCVWAPVNVDAKPRSLRTCRGRQLSIQ